MNEFITAEILGTITGCSALITLLTEIFKKYLPEKIDTKWLALGFSIFVGILRIVYIGAFDAMSILSGILNIFILLGVSIGLYEIVMSMIAGTTLKDKLIIRVANDFTDDTDNELTDGRGDDE